MNNNKVHFLYPSAIFTSKSPGLVTTVLGSCVSVCLWDPILKIGGMNHYMLPLWNGKGLASPKYGNIAIEKLIKKMLDMGSIKSNLKAKVFGGGEVIQMTTSMFNIGERNIALAKEMLNEEKIPIISSSLGGNLGRKIIFQTETGVINHKFIKKTNCDV